MKDIVQLLGADQSAAEIQMLEVLEFETKLAAMSLPRYLLLSLFLFKNARVLVTRGETIRSYTMH